MGEDKGFDLCLKLLFMELLKHQFRHGVHGHLRFIPHGGRLVAHVRMPYAGGGWLLKYCRSAAPLAFLI